MSKGVESLHWDDVYLTKIERLTNGWVLFISLEPAGTPILKWFLSVEEFSALLKKHPDGKCIYEYQNKKII